MKDIRVIIDSAGSGSWNMAVDEAIFESVAGGAALPVLRFYEWGPPCVSLGFHQRAEDIRVKNCRAAGIDIVRRLTGGRAVLHDIEITYSVIMPHPVKSCKSVAATFRKLNKGILEGLAQFGLQGIFQRGRRNGPSSRLAAICFSAPSQYEILVEGKKILGSAQMRSQGVLLHQGSIPLHVDRLRLMDIINIPGDEISIEEIPEGINKLFKRPVKKESLITALLEGFKRNFEGAFVNSALTGDELAKAQMLEQEKYRNDSWTFSR